MKRIYLILLSLCMVFSLCGQGKSKGLYIEIPYKGLNNGRIPVIEVSIKNMRYKFIVDTGSPFTSVTRLVVDECQLSIADDTRKVIDVYSITNEQPLAIVEHLRIGGIPVKALQAQVFDNNTRLFRCSGVDGIIGGDILKEFVVKFDSQSKLMILADKASRITSGKLEWKKMATDFSKSYCWVRLNNGASDELLFDSGNEYPRILIDSAAYQQCKEKNLLTFVEEEEGYGADFKGLHGQILFHKQFRALIAEFNFGGHTLRNIPVQEAPTTSIGFMMADLGDIILDYPRKRYCFIPFKDCEWKDIRNKANCGVIGSNLIITVIWDKELSRTITVGDRITQIGDQTFENMDDCYRTRLNLLLEQYATSGNSTVWFEKPNGERYSLPAEAFL
ncbi:retropepsin-like aspartic protease [Bacteroides sp. 51]|uniref:retropepsin-like aspartic protease n=1 Tax=Bacteroides sp. 51 TaxID=2302938 RepID=UPI0013D15F1D|nr:retropepsin-like aspartic protease [Bacteroides sp. 51]NDV80443.1 hypothetical protein [Bacteroides sp. 51]